MEDRCNGAGGCVTCGETAGCGMDLIGKSLNYSVASVEYAGLVSYSYLKRSGSFLAGALGKTTAPVWRSTVKGVDVMAGAVSHTLSPVWRVTVNSTVKGYRSTAGATSRLAGYVASPLTKREKRLQEMERRLLDIEKRLAHIEKNGVVMAQQEVQKEIKRLSEDKKAFLRMIVQENIELREEG